MLQFYEIDLPHASAIKQKLVDKVLPDAAKVSTLPSLPYLAAHSHLAQRLLGHVHQLL